MRIRIIGLPSARVNQTIINARAATAVFKEKPRIIWINDIHQIAEMGGVLVPTVMINEKIKTEGRIPSVFEFKTWIEEEMEEELAA